jgi:hypothetical protein
MMAETLKEEEKPTEFSQLTPRSSLVARATQHDWPTLSQQGRSKKPEPAESTGDLDLKRLLTQ